MPTLTRTANRNAAQQQNLKPPTPFGASAMQRRKPTGKQSVAEPPKVQPAMLKPTPKDPPTPREKPNERGPLRSKTNRPQKPIPTATAPRPPHPISNFNKPYSIARSYALACSNNSTPFW